jgi:hypothetical protein
MYHHNPNQTPRKNLRLKNYGKEIFMKILLEMKNNI